MTAAAPGAGSTMGLNADEWGSVRPEAMQDKTAAAFLMTSYANWRTGRPTTACRATARATGRTRHTHAGYWNDQSLRRARLLLRVQLPGGRRQAGEDGGGIVGVLRKRLTRAPATLLTSVAFSASGPEAGAAVITMDMVEDAGKDAFSSAAESASRQDHRGRSPTSRRRRPAPRRRGRSLPNLTTSRAAGRAKANRCGTSPSQRRQEYRGGLPAGLLQRRAVHRQPETVRAAVRRHLPELGRAGDATDPDERPRRSPRTTRGCRTRPSFKVVAERSAPNHKGRSTACTPRR